jgi:hypothetical protein
VQTHIPAAPNRTRWTTSQAFAGLWKGIFSLRVDKKRTCVKHVAGEISGGMKERLIIALCIAMRGKMHHFMLRTELARRVKLFRHWGSQWEVRIMTTIIANEISCPVCRATDSSDLPQLPKDYEYQVAIAADFGIRICNACRSEFVWPRPTLDQMRRMYPDNYYAYGTEMGSFWQLIYNMWCRAEAKRMLSLCRKRPLHLFDIGAGDCRRFKAMGVGEEFKFSGVEMNEEMAAAGCDAGFEYFTRHLRGV